MEDHSLITNSSLPIPPTKTGPKGYFLIIDRLNETLDTRIKHWKKLKRKASKKKQGLMGRTVTTRRVAKRSSADDISRQGCSFDEPISEDQVDVALQISSALMYLHSKNVMFRDLKPQNVGFDGKLGLCRDCCAGFYLRLKYHVLIFQSGILYIQCEEMSSYLTLV